MKVDVDALAELRVGLLHFSVLHALAGMTDQSGGMADALDSKSCARKGVWVRLPPLVLNTANSLVV